MEQQNTLLTMAPIIMMSFPFIFLNAAIAAKKGRSMVKYGLLGLLPIANFYCAIYLVSLPDIAIKEKLDEILEKLNKNSTDLYND